MARKNSQFVSSFDIAANCFKKLTQAVQDAGGSDEDIRRLETDEDLRTAIAALIVAKQAVGVIDLDADPFVPDGWKLESHTKGGSFAWDPAKIRLHLELGQQEGKSMKGSELQKALEGKAVLNANVLDYLLAHTELIPDSWKDKYVFFWGTVYRYSGGYLYVRCLCWNGDRWDWRDHWLEGGWNARNPAVVLASI